MSKKTKSIDEMSEDELNEALQAEVDSLDGNKSRYEPEETVELPEPEPTRSKAEEKKPEREPVKPDPHSDEAKEDEKDGDEGEESDDANPYRKRIDKLLRKKDRLEGDNQEKEKTISELQAKVRELQERTSEIDRAKAVADDAEGDEPTPEGPYPVEGRKSSQITVELLQKTIADAIAANESARIGKTQAETMDNNELNDLFARVPSARTRQREIMELSKEHPKLSFEALDLILSPRDHVNAERPNAQVLAPGARSRADLMSEPNVGTMKTHELKAMIEAGISSGEMLV